MSLNFSRSHALSPLGQNKKDPRDLGFEARRLDPRTPLLGLRRNGTDDLFNQTFLCSLNIVKIP